MEGAVTPVGKEKKDPSFLCDEMLGKLAKWLRLLGYDTSYIKTKDDGILVIISQKEDRFLLTRDKELSKRTENACYIESDDPDMQLIQVFRKYGLSKDRALTLCSVCSQVLTPVVKEKAQGRVPDRVYELNDEFLYCGRCHKFYWKGSHYDKITDRIDKL